MYVLETVSNTFSEVTETICSGLSKAKQAVCDFFDEDATLSRKTFALVCFICIMIGMIYGFLLAPVKKGIQVNVNNCCCDEDEDDEDED